MSFAMQVGISYKANLLSFCPRFSEFVHDFILPLSFTFQVGVCGNDITHDHMPCYREPQRPAGHPFLRETCNLKRETQSNNANREVVTLRKIVCRHT